MRAREREPSGGKALVTVVIPCYNQAHFLGEAIESVLNQSYPDFEIVVVDDGSTDSTSQMASGYARADVRLIRQENQGLSAARNRGLDEARGEYVVFLDADDRLQPEALKEGVSALEAHSGCAFVFGHYTYIWADGSYLGSPAPPHMGSDCYSMLLRGGNLATPAVAMFRRAVFESVGSFDTSMDAVADYDLYLRIASRFPAYQHGEPVAEYRRHGTNMSRDSELMLSSVLAALHAQRDNIGVNVAYQRDYRAGEEFWHTLYGGQLVRDHVRRREWRAAFEGLRSLWRQYPRGLPRALMPTRVRLLWTDVRSGRYRSLLERLPR